MQETESEMLFINSPKDFTQFMRAVDLVNYHAASLPDAMVLTVDDGQLMVNFENGVVFGGGFC